MFVFIVITGQKLCVQAFSSPIFLLHRPIAMQSLPSNEQATHDKQLVVAWIACTRST